MPDHESELPEQVVASEGAMAHEEHGYSTSAEVPAAVETTEAVGDTAMDETVQKVPVPEAPTSTSIPVTTPEDVPHDDGGEPDEATRKWREENWVGEDTARARVEVEKEKRDVAAESRAAAKEIDAFEPVPEGNKEYDDYFLERYLIPPGSDGSMAEGHRNRNKAIAELGQNPTIVKEQDRVSSSGRDIYETTANEAIKGEKDRRYSRHFAEKAESNDKTADQLGDWAEALHKNPPTETFIKDRTPDWGEITPEDLVDVEQLLADNLRNAEKWENKLTKLEEEYAESQAAYQKLLDKYGENLDTSDDQRWSMAAQLTNEIYEMTPPNSPQRNAYLELASADETTVKDLKNLYKDICDKRATRIRKTAGLQSKFLEDIRSGAAASYRGSPEAVTA